MRHAPPGGIETMISVHVELADLDTELGLNARRHRDDDQEALEVVGDAGTACSTPGGIETMISPGAAHRVPTPRVLNARRHRHDDQQLC
jgi:hypothetical protein